MDLLIRLVLIGAAIAYFTDGRWQVPAIGLVVGALLAVVGALITWLSARHEPPVSDLQHMTYANLAHRKD